MTDQEVLKAADYLLGRLDTIAETLDDRLRGIDGSIDALREDVTASIEDSIASATAEIRSAVDYAGQQIADELADAVGAPETADDTEGDDLLGPEADRPRERCLSSRATGSKPLRPGPDGALRVSVDEPLDGSERIYAGAADPESLLGDVFAFERALDRTHPERTREAMREAGFLETRVEDIGTILELGPKIVEFARGVIAGRPLSDAEKAETDALGAMLDEGYARDVVRETLARYDLVSLIDGRVTGLEGTRLLRWLNDETAIADLEEDEEARRIVDSTKTVAELLAEDDEDPDAGDEEESPILFAVCRWGPTGKGLDVFLGVYASGDDALDVIRDDRGKLAEQDRVDPGVALDAKDSYDWWLYRPFGSTAFEWWVFPSRVGGESVPTSEVPERLRPTGAPVDG